MRWARTLSYPRTRTWRPPNSSLSRPLIPRAHDVTTRERRDNAGCFNEEAGKRLVAHVPVHPAAGDKVSRGSRAPAVGSPTESPRWESCVDADVMMQLMGIPPSAVSTCSLYPIQEVVWPLALRLLPGPSAGLPASAEGSSCSCRSSRLGSFARASPLRGPPLAPLRLRCLRLRRRLLTSIAVASREMDGHPSSAAISVSCRRLARRLSQTRKRPAKTSPRSEAGRHRSSRTAGKACRQPQDARSGRASSECRTPPWL